MNEEMINNSTELPSIWKKVSKVMPTGQEIAHYELSVKDSSLEECEKVANRIWKDMVKEK